jgi:hypothetical protein
LEYPNLRRQTRNLDYLPRTDPKSRRSHAISYHLHIANLEDTELAITISNEVLHV